MSECKVQSGVYMLCDIVSVCERNVGGYAYGDQRSGRRGRITR